MIAFKKMAAWGGAGMALLAASFLASTPGALGVRSTRMDINYEMATLPPPPPPPPLDEDGGVPGGVVGGVVGRELPRSPVPVMLRMANIAAKAPGEPAPIDTKLIRTGRVSIEVQDFEAAVKELARQVKAAGGYISEQSTEAGDREKRTGQFQLRLPAVAFEEGLHGLQTLGKIRSESQSVQDISKEYVDLVARLKVKQRTALRLQEILQARTAKLADVLAAEKELARVTEEIESLEGERRFDDHQTAYCTLDVTLSEPHALVEPGAMAPLDHLAGRIVGVLANSFVALVSGLAFLAPWALLALLGWAAIRRLSNPKASPVKEPA